MTLFVQQKTLQTGGICRVPNLIVKYTFYETSTRCILCENKIFFQCHDTIYRLGFLAFVDSCTLNIAFR